MPQTQVDICNSALQRVGAAPILRIDDNSPEARACSIAYDSNRRDELRKYRWNFAITRAVLAPDSTAPAFDYDYQFTLPTNCVRVLRPNKANLDWVIEGRKILTNDSDVLNLRYIQDVEDVTQFDPSFYNVVAAALAIDIVERLTQSNTKKRQLEDEYNNSITQAKRVNAFEAGPEVAPDDDWWLARL